MLDKLERLLTRAESRADSFLARCEYEEVLLASLLQEGTTEYNAIIAIRDMKKQDRQDFQNKANDYIGYGDRITQGYKGIPLEFYNYAVSVNPTEVLANALEWARIEKLRVANDSTLVFSSDI